MSIQSTGSVSDSEKPSQAHRISELEYALRLSAERWRDLGEVIRERGRYDNAGFCEATARRCFSVLEGADWHADLLLEIANCPCPADHMNPIPSSEEADTGVAI